MRNSESPSWVVTAALTLAAAAAGVGTQACARHTPPPEDVKPAITERSIAAAPDTGPYVHSIRPALPPLGSAADSARRARMASAGGEVALTDAGAPLASVVGLAGPVSALYDPVTGGWVVADRAPAAGGAHGGGVIARLPREPGGIGVATRWVGGGDAGLTLRAPSGMAFAGDTLWVADERVLRGFDRKTGRSVTSVDLGPVGAVSLGDVASGPDGSLYVTDADRQLGEPGKPGLGEYGRIYRVFPSGRASSALLSGRIASPTWMAWDARAKRFVLAPSVGDTLFAWRPGQRRPQPLVAGPGRYRGVAATPEGRVFVASEATGGLYELRDGRLEEVLPGLRGVTDLAYDPVHRWLAVPMRDAGRVAFYAAPPAGAGRGRR